MRARNKRINELILWKVSKMKIKINWKVRLQHKQFWVSLIALLVVLANQIAGIFNVDITVYSDQVTSISETVLMILR